MRLPSKIIIALCTLCSCTSKAQDAAKTNTKTMKSIVIYFSRSGNNYVNGDIVNLAVE